MKIIKKYNSAALAMALPTLILAPEVIKLGTVSQQTDQRLIAWILKKIL